MPHDDADMPSSRRRLPRTDARAADARPGAGPEASTSPRSKPSWATISADPMLVARRIAELSAAGRELHQRGWVAANEGNLSTRLAPSGTGQQTTAADPGCQGEADASAVTAADAATATTEDASAASGEGAEILCTVTGVSKGHLRPADFAVIDFDAALHAPPDRPGPTAAENRSDDEAATTDGAPRDDGPVLGAPEPPVEQVAGVRPVTSEVRMHLAIYAANPQIRAIVHCHPPYATAWAIGSRPIPPDVLPEVGLFIGPEIPRAPYVVPGTWAFAETVRPLAARPEISAVLLTRHGLVTWGESVRQALWRTEIVEAYLRGLMLAQGQSAE